MPGNTHNPGL